jgi:hypothetical protein
MKSHSQLTKITRGKVEKKKTNSSKKWSIFFLKKNEDETLHKRKNKLNGEG